MKKYHIQHTFRLMLNIIDYAFGFNSYYPTKHYRHEKLVDRIIKFNAANQNPGELQRSTKLLRN